MPKVIRKQNQKAMLALDGVVAFGRVSAKTGWLDGQRYPEGPPIALVAAVNEFGWPEHNIPPRLGMRATAEAMRDPWRVVAGTVAGRVAKGSMTPQQAMDTLAGKAAGDIRKHITEVTQPPLKPATVEARLRGKKQGNVVSITIAKPLVFHGILLNTLTHSVETK